MCKPFLVGIFGLVLAAAPACATTGSSPVQPRVANANQLAATLLEFRKRIDRYMEIREDIADNVIPASQTSDPADIRGRENALATRIRARRSNARHGDIFTPDVRVVFRRLLRPELQGEARADILTTLSDDAPAPGAVPVEVNGKYPPGVPVATTPATLLAVLPQLPRVLEYRFVGKDLILLDQPADVILDYIRNAIE